jgi:urate oxidase
MANGRPVTEYAISYGKADVPVYRRAPAGRDGALVAAHVSVEVLGDNFLPAYTEGDNSMVVATDSMKNLILRETGSWEGETLESLLHHLGGHLLADYQQMDAVRVSGEEIRFDPAGPRGSLHARTRADASTALLELVRDGGGVAIADHRAGRRGIELLKLTGSAFTAFVRDGYTTLPERRDRPLWIALHVAWRYRDPADALGAAPGAYVAGERVRDLCAAVFEDLVSESIQHLVHAMGTRLLDELPGLAEVAFEARNLTRDPVVRGLVDTDPFPAHGTITLTLRR